MVMSAGQTARAVLMKCVLFLSLSGCGAGGVTVPQSEEPFLYLVLNQISISQYGDLDAVKQHALLTTAGTPLESPRYRVAERFEMRRTSDGAKFDWRTYQGLSAEPGTLSGVSMQYANYHLADSATTGGLGRSDLQPGATYEVLIETDGEEIRGSVTVPERFALSLVEDGGHGLVLWPRVAGAAGYLVSFGDGSTELQTDTAAVVSDSSPGEGMVVVHAVDSNLYMYLNEGERGRAGIDNGYGVFGAVTTAQLPLSRKVP